MKSYLLSCFIGLCLMACENPVKRMVRNAEYSGYEMIGVQKRDLLKRDIEATRTDAQEAAQTFKDSLYKLRELYAMPESQLERQYRSVQAAYKESDRKAQEVRRSREQMETVANDMFREWEGEIGQIQSSDLKSSSRSRLSDSRTRFAVAWLCCI